MLHHMDALKAIQYKAKTTKPQIIFTSPRIDSTSMVLSDSQYAILKQQALQRVEAILHYVSATSGCRSAMLLNYFGEEESKPCGVCDLCLTANHKLKKEKPHLPAATNHRPAERAATSCRRTVRTVTPY